MVTVIFKVFRIFMFLVNNSREVSEVSEVVKLCAGKSTEFGVRRFYLQHNFARVTLGADRSSWGLFLISKTSDNMCASTSHASLMILKLFPTDPEFSLKTLLKIGPLAAFTIVPDVVMSPAPNLYPPRTSEWDLSCKGGLCRYKQWRISSWNHSGVFMSKRTGRWDTQRRRPFLKAALGK